MKSMLLKEVGCKKKKIKRRYFLTFRNKVICFRKCVLIEKVTHKKKSVETTFNSKLPKINIGPN